MSKTKEVITRINSITSTKKITQAMKMVSAAKLAKFQTKSEMMNNYIDNLNDVLLVIKTDLENQIKNNKESSDFSFINKINNPYLENKTNLKEKSNLEKVLYIVVSSDKGLCGSFNSKLLKTAEIEIEKSLSNNRNISILPIGRKSYSFCKRNKSLNSVPIIEDHIDLISKLDYDKALKFSNEIMKSFINKKYTNVIIIYNKLRGSSKINIKNENFLPLKLESYKISKSKLEGIQYIFEPDSEKLLQDLIPKILELKIYSILLGSLTAENSARMIAMTKASDNAEDIIKELKLTYNRTRQAMITKELTEIVGGAEALRAGH
ncbi:MAG: ATP synthase F1 subunit gamma [Bacteroidetes bacterium]|nr:ATP synthase F1 subunit gamma [Bacteroidota bacterium]